MFIRKCPSCKKDIKYTSKYTLKYANDRETECLSCSASKNIKKINGAVKRGELDNGFKGKSHSKETIKKLKRVDKSYTKTKEFRNKISVASKGNKNPMYGKSFYSIWKDKYGKDFADKKLKQFKKNVSNATIGKNNPMYGKPSPQGSGNGWSGWYNGVFFRSLLELSFIINYLERFDFKYTTAETNEYAIKYTFNNKSRTYFADFIISEKYMVEIKPSKLHHTPLVESKTKAAIKYCKNNKLKFKLISPIKIEREKVLELVESGKLVFTERYKQKLLTWIKR